MLTYAVKEIFYTLQGEGANAGRPAIFCRFSGCNLWSGREEDRFTAQCQFCDTDFFGISGVRGGRYSAAKLTQTIRSMWPAKGEGFVVLTGGEPLLQVDAPLISSLHAADLRVAVETNGTVPVPDGIDWVCVSPKAGTNTVVQSGDELKLVFPQQGAPPERYSSWHFNHFYLQPKAGPGQKEHTEATIRYCLANPQWRLSLQTHKLIGIP